MRFFDSTLKNSFTFASNTKTMQMAREEVAEVSYCYYSRDSREIVRKFPCLEAAKFTDRDRTIFGHSACGPARTFLDVAPGKGSKIGYPAKCLALSGQGLDSLVGSQYTVTGYLVISVYRQANRYSYLKTIL